MKNDVYYNVTEKPIVIIARWHPDPAGGPAIPETQFMIAPGQGIDLSVIGLSNEKPKDSRDPSHGPELE